MYKKIFAQIKRKTQKIQKFKQKKKLLINLNGKISRKFIRLQIRMYELLLLIFFSINILNILKT